MENESKNKKSIFKKWWFWLIAIVIVLGIIGSLGSKNDNNVVSNNSSKPNTANTNQNNTEKPRPVNKERQTVGKATDLGAGTFTGGKDIPAGLYDVTPVGGQGNFTVTSKDGDLIVNEILGSAQDLGVTKVRAKISDGDEIQLQSIDKAHFEPVTSPFVKTAQKVTLYSGIWTVGEDIAPGRYIAAPGSGSGNFIVYDNGVPSTNEILGGDTGVKNVTANLNEGDTISIGSLNQVILTPSK